MNPRRPLAITASLALMALVAIGRPSIAPAPVASAAGSLQLSRAVVASGDVIAITGIGFRANSVVTIDADFTVQGTPSRVQIKATSNAAGTFHATLTVPAGVAPGSYQIMARDVAGTLAIQRIAVLSLLVLRPGMTLPAMTLVPTQQFFIRGVGWAPGERVSIAASFLLASGAHVTVARSATAGPTGSFADVLFQVPAGAAGGRVNLMASGSSSRLHAVALLAVNGPTRTITPSISLRPASILPGQSVTIVGTGFGSSVSITVRATFPLTTGGSRTVTTAVRTTASGDFSATLVVPLHAAAGGVTITAFAPRTSLSTRLTVLPMARPASPSIVLPSAALPGSTITISGSGFAANARITFSITLTLTNGSQRVIFMTALTNAQGRFSVPFTIPTNVAPGSFLVVARSVNGRTTIARLMIERAAAPRPAAPVTTRFYFPALYTGIRYRENLALLNRSSTRSRVTITYELASGQVRAKTITVAPHSRFTENVNADLGLNVSAAAVVTADTALVAERMVFHGAAGAAVAGATSPAMAWYFAGGNTGRGYRDYVAVQNPTAGPVQVALRLFPAHHGAFTVYRTMPPTSRTTFYVNRFVHRDAIGMVVRANAPIVAEQTIFIHHGMTSAIGARSTSRQWLFPAGPPALGATNWIAVVNPTRFWAHVTLNAYGPAGNLLGIKGAWLRPHGRAGYLVNRFGHTADAAVIMTSSRGTVAEQITYRDRLHDDATESFGVRVPGRGWAFAAANTVGQIDTLDLFNPSSATISVTVQFITASGVVVSRTYLVPPLSHVQVNANGVVPNAQLGIVASSASGFVAANQAVFNNGAGATSSSGIAL